MRITHKLLRSPGIRAIVGKPLKIPLFSSKVHAGFASPATHYIEKELDLNALCISHQDATYFFVVEGNCMFGGFDRIDDGDILVVDSAIMPADGQIIVACIGEEYLVRRIKLMGKMVMLKASNADYEPIYLHKEQEGFSVFGVVNYVLMKPPILP